jgi:hypothetical protein
MRLQWRKEAMAFRKVSSWPLLAILTLATPAFAQSTVTTADVQRLEDRIDAASRDISQLESRESAAASQLRRELEDVRDEATYMKVKLRKRERVAREDYWVLRDRVDDLEARATGKRPAFDGPVRESRPAATTGRASDFSEVPVGTEFDVRLERLLSSETAQVEDRFEATTLVDLRDGDRVIVPSGSTLHGIVNGVTRATRLERKGSLQVAFERLTIDDRSYPIRATVQQALESEGIRGEIGRIGAGSAVGGILGAIIGGAKGALIGVLIGGGGVTAATEGKDVELPAGTILRVRLDAPLTLD